MDRNILKQKKISEYLLIYLLLFFSSGYQLSVYSGTIRLLMHLGLVLLLITLNPGKMKQIKINQLSLLILIGVFCNVSLTVLVNSEGLNQVLITIALFLTAFIYTVYYDVKDFIEKYIRVMSFLCVFSLILYFTANILPQLVIRLPIIYNVNGLPAYNALFSTIRISDYLIRNQGIFWEPGAFQTYINLALIFNLFLFKENNRRNLIIFGITLFTTYSTTGYIVGSIIVLVFVLHSLTVEKRKKQKQILVFVCVIIILLIVGLITYNNLPENAKYQVFGKVAYYAESGNYSSTSVRMDAIIYPFKHFLENPFFGKGIEGLSKAAISIGYNMNTSTPINWFARYGIFMGLIMNYGLYRLCMRFECRKLIKILLFIAILLALFSEEYTRNPSVLVFVFYGYHYLSHTKATQQNVVANK